VNLPTARKLIPRFTSLSATNPIPPRFQLDPVNRHLETIPFKKEAFVMTIEQKRQYEETDALRRILEGIKGRKFKLDCGHHVTFGHHIGSDITIFNGARFKIICSLCSH